MNFFSIKSFLILLPLTAQALPSIAVILNTETIESVEIEISRPDTGI